MDVLGDVARSRDGRYDGIVSLVRTYILARATEIPWAGQGNAEGIKGIILDL